MTLFDDVSSYLNAEGWTLREESDEALGLVVASRGVGFGGGENVLSVLCPNLEPREWTTRGAGVLRRFAGDGAAGERFLVVESREGITPEFQRLARYEHKVQIRTPIQLFDAAFKWDSQADGVTAPSAAARLNRDGALVAKSRTPQPFRDEQTHEIGEDLFKELDRRFSSVTDWPEPVVLVSAPAGFGKSMLFSSLYASTYRYFQTAKREQRRAHRPLPLLPEYSATATGPTLRGLMDSFIRSDVARPIQLDTFEWMLERGYASLHLDGLDELISRDTGFFEYLEDILTRTTPVTPRILICVRDSLLSTSQGLRDFLTDSEGLVKHYTLLPWERSSIETFATMHARDQRQTMLDAVENPEILKLCGTPYYSHLLAEKLLDRGPGGIDLERSWGEAELIGDALNSIISREYDKGLLDATVVALEDVVTVVEDVAVMEIENGTRGVPIEDIVDLAQIVLRDDLSDIALEQAEMQFTQLSVFQGASELRRVRFAQDVIFEYLIGKRATEFFRSNPVAFVQLLSWRRIPSDSISLRIVRQFVADNHAYNDIQARLASCGGRRDAFVNILQIILGLPDADGLLGGVSLERQDLSGVAFAGVDLRNVSFKGANLEGASFSGCNLSGTKFGEAILRSTRFCRSVGSLTEADFGSLVEFVSVQVDDQFIDDVAEFTGLIKPSSQGSGVIGPCPTAMQLRFILLKFVRPDGKARRDWLDERAILRGREYTDPAPVLREAARAGLLTRERSSGRVRYNRATGDQYAEMVAFVRSLKVGDSVGRVLEEACARNGCRHVAEL
jgi:hypothetical protein